MRPSTAGLLSLYVLPAACRVLPTLLTQDGGTNNTTLVEVDSTLPSVSDSPVFDLPLSQLLFNDPDPPIVSSPDLHARNVPTPTPNDVKTVEKHDHGNILRRQDTPPTNEPIASGTKDDVEHGKLAKRYNHNDALWISAVCTGERLTQASLRDKDTTAQYVQPIESDFDGNMATDLQYWGYADLSAQGLSRFCSFANVIELHTIGLDTGWSHITPNGPPAGSGICFHVEHFYLNQAPPWATRMYRVGDKPYYGTGAYSHIGVNANDGLIGFFNVKSALKAAIENWGVTQPHTEDLPKLKKISDLAWGFWNRAYFNGEGLHNIKYFFAHDVINRDTQNLIIMALQSYWVPVGQQPQNDLPGWPGIELFMWSEEGKAMLGSPLGLPAAYLLIQHRTQLGGNKYIYKITIWRDDWGYPQMLFWVQDAPGP